MVEDTGCVAFESLRRKIVNCFFLCVAMLALLSPSGASPLILRIPDVPGISVNTHDWD